MRDLIPIVKGLLSCGHGEEWFAFMINWFGPNALREYISALSDAAAMTGCKEDPQESKRRISEHIRGFSPDAPEKSIKKRL